MLTLTTTSPYLDLNGNAPLQPLTTPAPIYHAAPVQLLPVPQDEPRQKRRRVEDGNGRKDSGARRRNLKECLKQQVLPHVIQAIKELPPGTYHAQDITIQTLTTIARSAKFRTRLDDTRGYLDSNDEAFVSLRVHDHVRKLAGFDQYRKAEDRLVSSIESRIVKSTPSESSSDDDSDASSIKESQVKPDPRLEPELELDPKPNVNKGPLQPREPPPLPNNGRVPYRLRTRRREPQPTVRSSKLEERPYLQAAVRDSIAKGGQCRVRMIRGSSAHPTVYHVDFTTDEVAEIARCCSEYEKHQVPATLGALKARSRIYFFPTLVGDRIPGRTEEDLKNFYEDLRAGRAVPQSKALILSAGQDVDDQRGRAMRASRVSALLLAREMEGNMGFGRTRQLVNFQNELTVALEDELEVVAAFTNCAGDITTGSWVSNASILCGTTAHSDTHNQQYNKPGNLLLCSTTDGTLRSVPDHRIPRPRVERGENSTEAMRRSQDPWLYSSVVSSDYDEDHDLAFTSSFDKSVKVWKVDHAGRHMECLATWPHAGNVNFVIAAKDGSGRVATGADSASEAVRVYTINRDNIAESTYHSFSYSRTDNEFSDKWAYCPATMQWGRTDGTRHLLLVGYSPRSTRGEDHDIPEDKVNSGEITLWDAIKRERIPVLTASTANVFEVAWHPDLPRFIVATTPCSQNIDQGVRTQIHVFQKDKRDAGGLDIAYGQFQSLDCRASDINEVTFVPNSVGHAYVTAACTDGNVYVWDTAQGDKAIHTLEHGKPLEEVYEDREKEDTGVKFTAWGSSLDRFYTGSSDGVVRVWNVRNKFSPFVRDLLEAPGPISFGAFSPSKSKLAVGDATGRVFIFSLDKRDEHESHFMTLPGSTRRVRRPRPLIPHSEPVPPESGPTDIEVKDNNGDDDDDDDDGDGDGDSSDSDVGVYSRRTFLDTKKLVLSRNPVIGAVQGPEYATTNLFRREAHLNEDPSLPLLAEFERDQQESRITRRGSSRLSVRRARIPVPPDEQQQTNHLNNGRKDLDLRDVSAWEIEQLVLHGALLDADVDEDWGFDYEELPTGLLDKGDETEDDESESDEVDDTSSTSLTRHG
ncbi:hypothetical protein B0T10DRAFT_444265 [Thelonectria olida]|uniref:Uncharacterized protein n=1 Tax=Thelonectria olida TaxID=1576542 RepID=A0A9P9AM85_9HYPO|nr:hypothetical protein B0T10DRAFT_444265 [Thelonectria olida]